MQKKITLKLWVSFYNDKAEYMLNLRKQAHKLHNMLQDVEQWDAQDGNYVSNTALAIEEEMEDCMQAMLNTVIRSLTRAGVYVSLNEAEVVEAP